jgi:hypothetical protein
VRKSRGKEVKEEEREGGEWREGGREREREREGKKRINDSKMFSLF